MEIQFEGLIQELEGELDVAFPDATFLGYYQQADGSVIVEIFTPNEDRKEIEEEMADKATDILSDYDYDVVFYVYDREEKKELTKE